MPTKIKPRRAFTHYIAEHREAKKLTQKQLAKLLRCDTLTVSRWETYATRIDMPVLAAIAEALYGDMAEGEDLLYHPDEPSPNQLLRRLPKDDQKYFLKQLRNAVDKE